MDINHPCFGKSCNECETCIFDVDIDDMSKNCGQFPKCYSGVNCDTCEHYNDKTTDENKIIDCKNCSKLVKKYLDESHIPFTACCNGVKIRSGNILRPRVIKAKTGPMLPIETPEWCPINNGIDEQVLKPLNESSCSEEKENIHKAKNVKEMTYYEKREELKKFPRHISWDDIKENDVFVVPKILTQSRKIIKVVIKNDTMIRCSEINEQGKESNYLTTIYPNDLDAVFINKLHRF